jgi:insulysin
MAYPRGYEHFDPSRLVEGYTATKHGYALYDRPIPKSANDQREYRLIRLDNGLEACLVSDKAADKVRRPGQPAPLPSEDASQAAAALSVRCGSMDEPDELPGLAHFCEVSGPALYSVGSSCVRPQHLLFQGSKKYPEHNAYDDYLSRHNGSSNAETLSSETSFYFDVAPSHLAGALDRFAGFFLSPLFRADCIEREVKAVDSEFQWRRQNDCAREEQLHHNLARPGHPYSRFRWGNLITLVDRAKEQGIDTREALVRFHDDHYSANLMKRARIVPRT